MRLLSLFLLSATLLSAAPSTDLGSEIQVPLEQSDSFALIHKATGKIRLIVPGLLGTYTSPPASSLGLPGITGATSGFIDGPDEFLIIASPTANRLVKFNVTTGQATTVFSTHPAPQFPAYLRKSGTAPPRLFLANTFNNPGESLAAYSNPQGPLNLEGLNTTLEQITSFQPFYNTQNGTRFAAGVRTNAASTRLFTYQHDSTAGVTLYNTVPAGLTLATNIRRQDNRQMLIGHLSGTDNIYLIPMSAPPAIDTVIFRKIPLTVDSINSIGSIAPVPSGLGFSGILITSSDGSTAAHYEITPANTLTLIQDFSAPTNQTINGLVPVPNHGLMLLSGPTNKLSTTFNNLVWAGSNWKSIQTGTLSPLNTALPSDFATLFWFSGEPLVDPSSQLLKMETRPDWTSKSSPVPIPGNILTETYGGTASGLSNPTSTAPSIPAGANHLLTNQFLDSVSLSTLQSTLALTLPPLAIQPSTGTYTLPVDVTALTNDDEYDVFYREAGTTGAWQTYTNAFTVSYPSTWQFYAHNPQSGINGPIITRQYNFTVSNFRNFDADGDSVPDFVERAYGLSPNSGADADADGYSDLDEILNGSNPNDSASIPATSSSPFNGEGFLLLAQATNGLAALQFVASEGDPADPAIPTDGVPIDLHGMTSNLLASAPTEPLTTPASLSGNLAARLNVGTPVPDREWLILNTPQYFDLNTPAPRIRGGREIYKVIQRPTQAPPTINPTLNGTDLSADTTAWIAAATAAYGSYTQVTALTPVTPQDTANAVLAEAAIYNALRNLSPADQASLNVPQDLSSDPGHTRFTLFGNRAGDAARTSLTPAMRDALIHDGLSYKNLITGIDNATAGASNLFILTKELYVFHVTHSQPTASSGNEIPLLPLPLDVLRTLARGGDLPAEYLPAVSPAVVTAAKVEMADILSTLANAYRPVETWTVQVIAPVIADAKYSYQNIADNHNVIFYEPDGDTMTLDQGLGLALGTRFSVTGYTDAPAVAGHDGLELISLNVLFIPLASDIDTNANLLADDWETFFFGNTGVVGPHDLHPINGYSYLQLYLLGHDPRDDTPPAQPIANLFPSGIIVVPLTDTNYAVQFQFPDAYAASFNFNIQQGPTLQNFSDLAAASTASSLGNNTYQINVGTIASTLPENFFRLYLSLKTP